MCAGYLDGDNEARRSISKPQSVDNVGRIGRDIYQEIVKGITVLRPVSGRIYVEVLLDIEDNKLFGDDEARRSKLIIEIALHE